MENNKGKVRDFNMPDKGLINKIKYLFTFIGAGGMLMSAAMGPGTLSTALTSGSRYGYMLLWVIVLSGVFNGLVAYTGGKIACLTGKNVYEFFDAKYGTKFTKSLMGVVLITWILVIYSQGAAFLELVSFFVGTNGPISILAFILVEIAVGYTFTKDTITANRIASAMVTITSLLFLINIFVVKPNGLSVAKGLVPNLPPLDETLIIAAIIGSSAPGTSAAWYSFSVKDEGYTSPKNLRFIAWDQIYFSVVFTIFSIGAFISAATVLNPKGVEVSNVLDAALALEPLAGSAAKWIFALGFFGALFTTVGGMSNLLSLGISTFRDLGKTNKKTYEKSKDPMKKLVWIGVLASTLGGLLAKGSVISLLVNFIGLLNVGGFVIILLITLNISNKKFAGEYTNKPITTIACWLLVAANFYGVVTYLMKLINIIS